MGIRHIIAIVGGIVPIGIGLTMLIPAIYSLCSGANFAAVFFGVAVACFCLGIFCQIVSKIGNNRPGNVQFRSAFAIVTLTWLVAALLGAVPYYCAGTFDTFIDCFFESMSGFTGTGASVMEDIEGQGRDILLWRSITQFLGGMGVVTFFIAVLPALGINGVHLFRAEVTGPQKEKITPRVTETARTFWMMVVGILCIVTLSLWASGLSFYDAINHAFTAVSTGGFSTKNNGIAAFHNTTAEYILAFTMLVCSINFSLFYLLLLGRFKRVFDDTELKGYLLILFVAIIVLTYLNWGTDYSTLSESFRMAFFTVTNTASSTGFTNANYVEWGYSAQIIVALLMLMGGMAGSTSGGIKCVRIIAAWRLIVKELKTFLHPNALLNVKINNMAVRSEIASLIWAFIFVYFLCLAIVSAILAANGLGMSNSVSISISVLSNIGPAFGDFGPYGSFVVLPAGSKIVMALAMLIGRLEFFTVLVILTPAYWRK